MLQNTNYEEALACLANEETILAGLIATEPRAKRSGAAGLAYLKYFKSTWFPRGLWESWSQKARNDAASVLGITTDGVLPTTNHLESFNGVLKRKWLAQYQRAGRRLRFDVLIFRLIISILPCIYAHHRMINTYRLWKIDRFRVAAGGAAVAPAPRTSPMKAAKAILAWYEPDTRRDAAAQDIVNLARIISVLSQRQYELWASCAATGADMTNPCYERYWLTAHPSSSATCTCLDWLQRGGACKHLRAFRHLIETWLHGGLLPHRFHFPASHDEAACIADQNRHWYGPLQYEIALTRPLHTADSGPTSNLSPNLLRATNSSTIPIPPHNSLVATPSLDNEADLEAEVLTLEPELEKRIESSYIAVSISEIKYAVVLTFKSRNHLQFQQQT